MESSWNVSGYIYSSRVFLVFSEEGGEGRIQPGHTVDGRREIFILLYK
jgi:hypothetical protein